MDYKEKYNAALERARELSKTVTGANYEYIFPELQEDNDERIRKTLIELVRCNERSGYFLLNNIETSSMIAWLEKQKEPEDSGEISTSVNVRKKKATGVLGEMIANINPESLQKTKEQMIAEVEQQIKRCIGMILTDVNERRFEDFGVTLKECLEWLEKQGEQKPILGFKASDWYVSKVDGKIHNMYYSADKVDPKFKVGDWITTTDEEGNVTTEKIIEFCGDKVRLIDNNGFYTLWPKHELNYYHLWTIADAKEGDVLYAKGSYFKEYVFKFSSFTEDNVISTHFGYDVFHGTFDTKLSRFGREEDFVFVHPATKEQRDMLFQKMTDADYEWDADKKKLKKIEQKPVDKAGPKFHPGDWIVDDETPNDVFCVIEVLEEIYKVIDDDGDDYHIPHCKADGQFHLWTIQDAKDGDMLVTSPEKGSESNEQIFLFKEINSRDYVDNCIEYYFRLFDGVFYENTIGYMGTTLDIFYPATKEQRELLFQKMKEAGYEWDAEKKKLKKIEQKSSDEVEPKFKAGDWV